ncbi:acid protease [Marasmius fiardii PR-910]|nr:acid protease [Marasmius fiardii PR-910]
MTYIWKGKQKATAEQVEKWRRDEEDGDGAILKMEYVGTGAYDQTYVVPLKIGSSQQTVSLQVDTGSADIWIASSLCSSCDPDSKKYDPNSSQTSQSSNVPFNITYLRGKVIGTIYWDTLTVGKYSVENQALAAATDVQNEPLSSYFNGVFGLALPGNSVITGLIPAGTAGGRDGAHITSNLFSISPSSLAPAARFISLTLSRPGSDAIPSLMGIGKHPSIPSIGDGTKVKYFNPLTSTDAKGRAVGAIFWKTSVRDITVWVDNQPRVVKLSRSGIGGTGGAGPYPTAVLDTGIPLIFATRAVADAIYGAIGISPASDGFYYLDCKTPLNLTITLDDRPPISLHPLDLTAQPPRDATSNNCVGLIQAADGDLQTANAADIILGVPFIRNVYTVMAYQSPEANGTFADLRSPDNTVPDRGDPSREYRPFLGLQGLTDPSVAMNEFHRVRVQGLPLSGDNGGFIGGSDNKKKINVGLEILFALLGFVVLCVGLFGLRWCLLRRKYRTAASGTVDARREFGAAADAGATAISSSGLFGWWKKRQDSDQDEKKGNYELAVGRWSEDEFLPHEDVLRRRKFDEHMRRERMKSEYTVSSSHTHVDIDEEDPAWKNKKDLDVEVLDTLSEHDSVGHSVDPQNDPNREWDPVKELDWGENRATLVGRDSPMGHSSGKSLSPERRPMFSRRLSEDSQSVSSPPPVHSRIVNVRHHRDSSNAPLLRSLGPDSGPSSPPTLVADFDLREFGALDHGMAGIGSAARISRIDSDIGPSTADTNIHHKGETSLASRTDSGSLSPDSRTAASFVDEFASLHRPLSTLSTHSSTKERPPRSPIGPRPSANR